jgi:tRNA dimethylallyltransferase
LALVGPTASGKTALALAAAPRCQDVEVVSVDSMAVYRGMDIGTAKPSAAERSGSVVHMIDVVDPWEDFTVRQYQAGARSVMAGIASRGRRALLVGGTGLYLRSLTDDLTMPGRWPEVAASLEEEADSLGSHALHLRLERLDPEAATRIEPSNRRRIVRALEVTIGAGLPFSSFGPGLLEYPPSPIRQVGIRYRPEVHDERIRARFRSLVERGLLDEVRALAADPRGLSRTARQAIGYKELIDHLCEGVPLERAVEDSVKRTLALARRQWAWFRRDPRIEWLDPSEDLLEQVLSRWDAAAPVGMSRSEHED